MTAKHDSAVNTPSSPTLSSTVSSVASVDVSPITSDQSIAIQQNSSPVTFAEISKREQEYADQKRKLSCMNDESTYFITSHEDDDQSIYSEDSRGKKPGRKPMADEECDLDDDDEDQKIKRKARNRAAQRAFRERKERYVKELEKKIKYVQDNHIYATTQLFQENQRLRYVIYKLEAELGAYEGVPISEQSSSWLASVGPTSTMKSLQPSTSFASTKPLQTCPFPIANIKPRKIIPNLTSLDPTSKKQKLEIRKESNSSPNDNQQKIRFSITTPTTLKANSDNELIRKSEQIQAVQLYPNHSHPANCLLENRIVNAPSLSPTIQYSSSIASSVTSTDDETSNSTQPYNDISKPFLDNRGNLDFGALVKKICQSPARLISDQFLDDNQDWNNSLSF